MKKVSKKTYIIISGVILVLLLLIGGTIAYFGWTSAEEDKDSTVDVVIAGGTGSCTKLTDNNKLLLPTSSREKGRIITMKANQRVAEYATITWNLVINRINTVGTTTSGLKHESFKYELINTTTGVSYGSGNFSDKDTGSTITFTADEALKMNTDYTFTLYLWIDGELGINPNDMQNQTYDFDMNCSITGTNPPQLPTAAEYISNLYTNAQKTTVTINNITYNYAPIFDNGDDDPTTNSGLMNDRLGGTTTSLDGGNIRYYGEEPNNYIYFNCNDYNNQAAETCELWRIIGVFEDKVKIIRNEDIGSYSWDNKDTTTGAETDWGKNDWTDARLMKLLNPSYTGIGGSLYYNGGSGICYSGGNNNTIPCDFTSTGLKNDKTRNKIAEVTWNLGGCDTIGYPDILYACERGTAAFLGRTTTWNGKVALMYPSDSFYARSHKQNSIMNSSWLLNNAVQWQLTSDLNRPVFAYTLSAVGNIFDYKNGSCYLNHENTVRPTLFLNSEEIIEIGTGTSDNPYKLKA